MQNLHIPDSIIAPGARYDFASRDGSARGRVERRGDTLLGVVRYATTTGTLTAIASVSMVEVQRELALRVQALLERAKRALGVAGDRGASVPKVRDRLTAMLEAIAGDELMGGDELEDFAGASRLARKFGFSKGAKARKEKMKRGAARFRRALGRAAKAIARSKLVGKLRAIWQGIFSGKLASKALNLAGPALGMAFGGPLGAALGGRLAGALTASKLEQGGQLPRSSSAADLYRLGCACG